ncbi:MAG: hypothetical protein ACKO96_46875 [Flammeovirgaceae bacterium]
MSVKPINPNITISLHKAWFQNQGGLFSDVFKGKITHIADLFQRMGG